MAREKHATAHPHTDRAATENTEPAGTPAGQAGAPYTDGPAASQDAITAAEVRAREAEDQALRATAELQNVKRRQREEIERIRDTATKDLVLAILPVVDDLERALSAAGTTQNYEALHTGVELTLNKLLGALKSVGVERMEGAGAPFDPNRHEAVQQTEPSDEFPSGTISAELRPGYTQHGHIIRPSMVAVAHE